MGLSVKGDAPAGHQEDGQEGQQADAELHQRQDGLQQKGQGQTAQHQHGGTYAATLDLVEHLMDVIGVVGQPGDQGGGGVAVRPGAGQVLDLMVQVPPQIPGHLHGYPCRHAVGQDVAGRRAEGQHQHQSAGPPDGRQIPGRDQNVDDVGQQQGEDQLQNGGGKLDEHAAGGPPGIGAEVSQNCFHAIAFFSERVWTGENVPSSCRFTQKLLYYR